MKQSSRQQNAGVLTYFFPRNYGAAWQTWAMCSLARDANYSAQVLNYIPPLQRQYYQGLLTKSPASLLRLPKSWTFGAFRKQHLHISESGGGIGAECLRRSASLDSIICGSDEIWSSKQPGGLDRTYFLEGLPSDATARRIAFAVSAGQTEAYDHGDAVRVAELLHRFDYIAVRDGNTQRLVSQLTGIAPPVVLDPTLVADMRPLVGASRESRKPYALVFSPNESAQKFASRAARAAGVQLRSLQHYCPQADKNHVFAGPVSGLRLLASSAFVITSYFHGAALSIAMRRPFIAVNDGRRTVKLGDLSERLGFKERFIDCSDLEAIPPESAWSIDWGPIADRHSTNREHSLSCFGKAMDKASC